MEISVIGLRASYNDWTEVQSLPVTQLPPLTPAQRRAAEQLHIPEADYQRSIEAGRRTQNKLLERTKWFAQLLRNKLRERAPTAVIKTVALDTWKDRYEIVIQANGRNLPVQIAEGVVDSLFDLGSEGADSSLSRMVEECLHRFGIS